MALMSINVESLTTQDFQRFQSDFVNLFVINWLIDKSAHTSLI
jgi:hypothetical protein